MSNDDPIDLDEYEPPERDDFRRVGRWFLPHVMNVEGTKRVTYRRSSSAGKVLDDESNLTDWKLRTAIAGAAQRPELMALASTYDVNLHKKELRDIAEQCLVAGKGQRRSITGVAVHSMFDHLDRDEDWEPAPQFRDLCLTYQGMKAVWGLIPEEIEIHCINDEWKLAGRLDRRYRTTIPLIAPDGMIIPISSYIVADFKTGHELEYAAGSYVTQLAAYTDSMRYDVHTDERTPFEPESVKDWALIIHADSMGTRIDIYWADLAAGRLGLVLADQVRDWRRRNGLLIQATELRLVEAPALAPEPVALAPEAAVAPRRLAARHEYLRDRVKAIVGHSEPAARALQREWPMGIPGLKNEGHSWQQLDAIDFAIQKVEDQFSMPLPPAFNDPGIEESVRHHPAMASREPKPPLTKENIQERINQHPRRELIRQWIQIGIEGGRDHSLDTTQLAHALEEFAGVDESEWSDGDLTMMLDGSLRALGYMKGCRDLGRFKPEHAPLLLTAAFAIAAGNATLLFDENDNPVVRTNIVRG